MFISKPSICILLAALLSATTLSAKSLWLSSNNNERGFFLDNVAANIGDILTVEFDEDIQGTNEKKFSSGKKDAKISNEVTQFLFPKEKSGFGTHKGALPKTDITGNNTYSTGGKIENKLTRGGKASVMITDKLPNGNLVIEGARRVHFSEETLYMVLTGIVRQQDITHTNTIKSHLIADANLEFLGEGDLSAIQKKGWLLKLNDRINPF